MKKNAYLRVKLKSLAEEARIIRLEERRANTARNWYLQNSLSEHRKLVVRAAARETLLAYQYLRGFPYSAVEPHTKENNPVNWQAVISMVRRYGRQTLEPKKWIAGECLQKAA